MDHLVEFSLLLGERKNAQGLKKAQFRNLTIGHSLRLYFFL